MMQQTMIYVSAAPTVVGVSVVLLFIKALWKSMLDMHADLSVFYGVYGHSQISKNHNLKLYCWLCTQKHVLSQSTLLLSPTKVKCHELLLHLGIKF